jgi:hypothetical protein
VVAYLLKARTVEPEKQPLLGNGCVTHNNGVTAGSSFLCGPCRDYIMRTQCHYEIEKKNYKRLKLGGGQAYNSLSD